MIKRYVFRDFSISRSVVPHMNNYKGYKSTLRSDFRGRCGYCNAAEKEIVPFHADHFVPWCECIGPFSYLKTDYRNLVLACPVCNRYKSSQFAGDLSSNPYINSLFYNPIENDFRLLFYRNKYGVICSDDSKGIDMIIRLKLYSSLHAIEWALEQINHYADATKRLIEQIEGESRVSLTHSNTELLELFREFSNLYLGCYRRLASLVVE